MISRETRLDIFRALLKEGSIWGNDSQKYAACSYFSPLDFLSQIWDLRRMSSSDPRFTDAYQDAHQHLMNNDDWDEEYTFIDRFKLLDCGEEEFIKFLNVVLSPDVRGNKRDIEKYSSIIEKHLPEDYSIIQVDERNGLKVLNVTINNFDRIHLIDKYEDKAVSKYPEDDVRIVAELQNKDVDEVLTMISGWVKAYSVKYGKNHYYVALLRGLISSSDYRRYLEVERAKI